MLQFLRTNKYQVLFILFILTLIPHFAKIFHPSDPGKRNNEKYDASLARLNDLNELISYTDETFSQLPGSSFQDTAPYVAHMSDIFKERFYHGELNYTFAENWIAWACGKIVWSHLSSIVVINDILK